MDESTPPGIILPDSPEPMPGQMISIDQLLSRTEPMRLQDALIYLSYLMKFTKKDIQGNNDLEKLAKLPEALNLCARHVASQGHPEVDRDTGESETYTTYVLTRKDTNSITHTIQLLYPVESLENQYQPPRLGQVTPGTIRLLATRSANNTRAQDYLKFESEYDFTEHSGTHGNPLFHTSLKRPWVHTYKYALYNPLPLVKSSNNILDLGELIPLTASEMLYWVRNVPPANTFTALPDPSIAVSLL